MSYNPNQFNGIPDFQFTISIECVECTFNHYEMGTINNES